MNKFKVLLGYVLGFITSAFLVILTVLMIIRITIFRQNYVFEVLDKVNYYDRVYEDTKKDFSNSLHSSGLDDSILFNIYSSSDIERDVKDFIASLYSGNNFEVDSDEISDKLNNNVDNYLKDNNLQVDKGMLKEYVDGIVSTYKNQIKLFGYLDGFAYKFIKICKYLDVGIVFVLFILILSLVVLRYALHRRYCGVVTLSSGLMLIYLKYFVYDGIDFKNIVIISDSFSDFIRHVFMDIGNYVFVVAIFYIIIGVVLNVKSSVKKVKIKKKMKI